MKKPTMIIGRKQIVLSALTLVLGAAVYLNYVLADGNGLFPAGFSAAPAELGAAAEPDDLASYGTAEMVSATPSQADYFAQARLDKQTSRDYAVQTLQSIIGGGDLSNDEMVTNAIDAVSISKQMKSESVIESLILSQGSRRHRRLQSRKSYSRNPMFRRRESGSLRSRQARLRTLFLLNKHLCAHNTHIYANFIKWMICPAIKKYF